MTFSLNPTTGAFDDFDFDLFFDKENFGASSDNISVKGSFKDGDDTVEFTAKVGKADLLYSLGEKEMPAQNPT